MKLERVNKPLDYDAEGRKNLEGTYQSNDTDSIIDIDNYDLLFDVIDPYTVDLLRGEIDDDDKAALDAARSESNGIAAALAESEKGEPWNSNDIGKEFINIPATDKKQAEQQDYHMEPLSPELFHEISDNADQADLDMQAKFDKMAAELEGIF